MTSKYRGIANDQVHELPLNLHYNRCSKCRGYLKFISTDGEYNTWSCGGRCGLFAFKFPISDYEKRETKAWQEQQNQRIKSKGVRSTKKKDTKLAFKERWLARVKLQRTGALR